MHTNKDANSSRQVPAIRRMLSDNPGAILQWLSTAETAKMLELYAESPGSQDAQNFRAQLCSTYIPKLQVGSNSMQELGMADDDKFAAKLKECCALLEKLGGPVEVAGVPPAQDPYVLRLLQSPLPTAVPEVKKMYIDLRTEVEGTGLSDLQEAEACLKILRHAQEILLQGSKHCQSAGIQDDYLELHEDCRRRADHLDTQVSAYRSGEQNEDFQWEWKPYKLIDSVLDRHTNLIRCVDRLLDNFGAEFRDLNLKFPEIVVVGTESVGKSSVMEKLAGVPIFPRGEGVTTRKSFRLRLHHLTEPEMAQRKAELPPGEQPWHVRNTEVLVKFEGEHVYVPDPEEVRRRVQRENQAVADKGLGVDKGEVILNMYSTVFPDLTLLDMPGLIRARGARDPEDIVHKCEELVREKIGHEDAIVLAVVKGGNSMRGTAEGIRLVQQLRAEPRTLAVLTCVDRTDAEDEIPAVMRQTSSLELPRLGYHYHAVIGRDVKRTATGQRANRADCERFEQAVRGRDVGAAVELLDGNRVSEEALTNAMQLLAEAEAAGRGSEELARRVQQKLEETRQEQDKFEDQYFQALPASGEPSAWQRDKRVDPDLLAADLQEYLGSTRLGKRLSEMLENHIRATWAPRMSDAVAKKQAECRKAQRLLGAPPLVSDASKLVERFLSLLSQRRPAVCKAMVAAVDGINNCPSRPGYTHSPRSVSLSSNSSLSHMHSSTGPNLASLWQPASSSAIPHSAEGFANARKAAVQAVLEGKKALLRIASEVLADSEPDLCLHRFPVFRQWVLESVQGLAEQKSAVAQKRVAELIELLEPDDPLPGDDTATHYGRLLLQLGDALPRSMHKHLVKELYVELPRVLQQLPKEGSFRGQALLTEDAEHARRRRQIKSQLTALQSVKEELRAYEQEAPDAFKCPISKDVMQDPVVAPDGRSYERWCIEEYIRNGGSESPLGIAGDWTDVKLQPNRNLKDQILSWKTTPRKPRPSRGA